MSRNLPATLVAIFIMAACGPSTRNSVSPQVHASATNQDNRISNAAAGTDLNETGIHAMLAERTALSLLDLPVSDRGEIILSEGYYEAEFKSYCLQPGTPDPSDRDAYLQMPLAGPRREILETALRNSINRPDLRQEHIQLLLWSVVSGSDFNRLAPGVKRTAGQLLTAKQVFELKGGVMGLVKTASALLPESALGNSYKQVRNLFEIGSDSYEAYERIAVLRQPSVIRYPDYKKDQWYKHAEGYYLRYFPKGYQRVKVQVYVPEGLLDSAGLYHGQHLLFDPVSTMAIPANSNAQRLGIGAPVADVIRKVIQIHREMKPRREPSPKPTFPKPPAAETSEILK
jgi:hypothetical protein